MNIVVLGAAGFIGRNLQWHLREQGHTAIAGITRTSTAAEVDAALAKADFVFQLAGVNRPEDPAQFASGNAGFTRGLVGRMQALGRPVPIAFASSTQAALDNPYGRSKLEAEQSLAGYGRATGAPVYLLRLTNVFGKWARPFYNSAVATFCHQAARGEELSVNDPQAPLRLVYVDDVVETMAKLLDGKSAPGFVEAGPVHDTTVGQVAELIRAFSAGRKLLQAPRAGKGLERALYATWLSHLPPAAFDYAVPRHADPRGEFVEMLKTSDSGQFSYFTAHPGVTRGGHYHHTKSEKFLVLQGTARFGFRHIETGQTHELLVRGGEGRIVDTIPGWTHDITNVGTDTMIVMLWANEVFDRERPDTVAMKVAP
ncbi:MAG: NAD-dependent epimerase/dehydratase family protein [Burkholderiaceae bacterium]|jgi:UDP-2-acetamido-2,6-beta-L-arabino-hexul-4-ose reductase|nr:NAD-dependent epimerase/dehydratase family protein [Burkholderiaceae bacterium]